MSSGTVGSRLGNRCIVAAAAVLWIVTLTPSVAEAQTKPPKRGSTWDTNTKKLLGKVKDSTVLKSGWMVETPTHIVHTRISKEYTAAAAAYLWRFDDCFRSIFHGEYKDKRKPVAYAFPTEEDYLKFSPDSRGTQGRFRWKVSGKEKVKDLAWFSTPPGETDFYKTEFGVVQHEATHQLLDAYTDNQRIPKWFHEGCATFFESWDLDKKNEENILSGLGGNYALGIALTYPGQKQAPPLSSYWIEARALLKLEDPPPDGGLVVTLPPDKNKKPEFDFAGPMRRQQEYNEAWCAMTFFIDHKIGQEVFKKLVGEFQKGATLESISKAYYTETFLSSFEKEWAKFIEAKVLRKWSLPAVSGEKVRPGNTDPPPNAKPGFALTGDRRGDMYIVEAEGRKVAVGGETRRVIMLEAWSVPVAFYEEAWKQLPEVLSKGQSHLVGGLYAVSGVIDPSGLAVMYLLPAWAKLSKDDKEHVVERLVRAAGGLAGRIPIDVLRP